MSEKPEALRYDVGDEALPGMYYNPDGDWVRYKDYEQLTSEAATELRRLCAENERLTAELQEKKQDWNAGYDAGYDAGYSQGQWRHYPEPWELRDYKYRSLAERWKRFFSWI